MIRALESGVWNLLLCVTRSEAKQGQPGSFVHGDSNIFGVHTRGYAKKSTFFLKSVRKEFTTF